MGAADDIRNGLTKNLAPFTKQRKAEEKHVSAGRWRASRMTEVRGKFLKEAAEEVMQECYLKASDNGTLPATARQIFYVARPLIEALIEPESATFVPVIELLASVPSLPTPVMVTLAVCGLPS